MKRDTLLGFMGVNRPVDGRLKPPHYKVQLRRHTILHVVAKRILTFDGFVIYNVEPYLTQLKKPGLDHAKMYNWKRLVKFNLTQNEIPIFIYLIEQALNWITRNKLLDHEWEEQQRAAIAGIEDELNKEAEEKQKQEEILDEIAGRIAASDEESA